MAIGVAQHIVELVVDVLGLPFAVDRPRPLGELGVIAVDGLDADSEPIAQRLHQIVGERRPGRGQGIAGGPCRDLGETPQGLRTSRRRGAQVRGDHAEIAIDLIVDPGQQIVDRTHRLLGTQAVEDVVLLVGKHPLELATAAHDQRRQCLVAPGERCRRVRLANRGVGRRAIVVVRDLVILRAQAGEQVVDVVGRDVVVVDLLGGNEVNLACISELGQLTGLGGRIVVDWLFVLGF